MSLVDEEEGVDMGKKSMKDYVYETIKNGIYEQKLVPGQKLIENEISNSLSISRTPIRQAFAKLEREGFLTLSLNKGAQVVNPSAEEIAEAFIHRRQLELLATENIMETMKEEEIERLKKLVQSEEQTYKSKDLRAYIKVNKEFHYTLISGCQNRFLKENVMKMIHLTHIYMVLYDHFYHLSDNIRGSDEHKQLIAYIEEKDKASFSKLLAAHIDATIDEYKDRVRRYREVSDLFTGR